MISLVFRVVLILCSLFTAIFIIRKIRQSKVQINYAIFGFSFRHACLFLVFFLNYLFHSPVYWEYIHQQILFF